MGFTQFSSKSIDFESFSPFFEQLWWAVTLSPVVGWTKTRYSRASTRSNSFISGDIRGVWRWQALHTHRRSWSNLTKIHFHQPTKPNSSEPPTFMLPLVSISWHWVERHSLIARNTQNLPDRLLFLFARWDYIITYYLLTWPKLCSSDSLWKPSKLGRVPTGLSSIRM